MDVKSTTAIVSWFINEQNMEYLFFGDKITNLDEIRKSVTTGTHIYAPRDDKRLIEEKEYPNINDVIVAEYIGMTNDGKVNIKVLDPLYFAKLSNPTIKMNGYCIKENSEITITKLTRLTLANKNGNIV